ncbi:hypothetical protein CROQUDRAFT_99822 [Cronartium quercuum f. sp. fusiforme G11]|uniref:Uncharacterized protein n=1 Tax=Cronartium quercuum f. sp. fusiforme G11 TaxID=708437 RepID=A0A9P6N7W0_9BASI|nr:hypothetical protein CROQUDRAFT_99822 [Cronartium quercuum f. sp. fusiforme G11]
MLSGPASRVFGTQPGQPRQLFHRKALRAVVTERCEYCNQDVIGARGYRLDAIGSRVEEGKQVVVV